MITKYELPNGQIIGGIHCLCLEVSIQNRKNTPTYFRGARDCLRVLSQIYEGAGFTPSAQPGQSFTSFLNYLGANASLYNSADILLTLAVVAFIPATFALFVAMRKTDIGISVRVQRRYHGLCLTTYSTQW